MCWSIVVRICSTPSFACQQDYTDFNSTHMHRTKIVDRKQNKTKPDCISDQKLLQLVFQNKLSFFNMGNMPVFFFSFSVSLRTE